MKKQCTKCKDVKELGEFNKNKNSPDGRSVWCKICSRGHAKTYRQAPRVKELRRRSMAAWYAKNKNYRAEYETNGRLLRAYGITVVDYINILHSQNNTCAICKQVNLNGKKLAVDHDHVTGRVRGLLCSNCNIGLGGFQDDTDRMLQAVQYILRSRQ